jgi:hypothetical protein
MFASDHDQAPPPNAGHTDRRAGPEGQLEPLRPGVYAQAGGRSAGMRWVGDPVGHTQVA